MLNNNHEKRSMEVVFCTRHIIFYLSRAMLFRSVFRFASVKSFGVIGSGQMGTGIAIVANRVAKLPVTLYDSNPISLQKSKNFVESWLKKEEGKNRITAQDIQDFSSRIKFAEDINSFKDRDVDFVVEVNPIIRRQ